MSDHEKTRDAASEALIALRKAMKKTQQSFAVEDLKTAVGTVARYETSHPPRGDVLLDLARIAEANGFLDLRDTFKLLFIENTLKELPSVIAANGRGFLLARLEGDAAIRGALGFQSCEAASRSVDPKLSRRAVKVLDALYDEFFKSGNPEADAIRETLATAMAGKRR